MDAFAAGIERVLANRERLRTSCLARREAMSVERAVDRLSTVYDDVRAASADRVRDGR
jgi:hypothetical protein